MAALMSAQTPIMASETETATEQVLQETQTETESETTNSETESKTTNSESETVSFEEQANQSDGISMQALTEGWNVDENGRRMYVKNGNPIKGRIEQIDGNYYQFDMDGYLYINHLTIGWDSKQYYCGSNGVIQGLPDADWLLSDGTYYYSKNGSLLKNCVEKINGVYYGFDYAGELYLDTTFSVWEGQKPFYYIAKADGSLYTNEWSLSEPDENGNRYWNYYGSDAKRSTGIRKIDGLYYYFEVNNWRLAYNRIAWEDGIYYYCGSDGVATLLENNSWTQADGEKFYVRDGNLLQYCVASIDGMYYGFGDSGKLYVDTSFTVWDEEDSKRNAYHAKEDGSLCENEWYVAIDGDWYYYGAKGKAYTGVHVVNGKQYCFTDEGQMYRNACVYIDGEWYTCDADGEARKLQGTGWIDMDGDRFYLQDGNALSNCTAQIDGTYYGFSNSGTMYRAEDFSIANRETRENGYYRAKEDGSLYENEWYVTEDGSWYYYGDAGKAYSGLREMNGKNYYFGYAGQQYRNTCVASDGECYYCAPDGEIHILNNSGWTNLGEKTFYVKDGEALSNCIEKINGFSFGFSESGIMYCNKAFTLYDFKEDHAYSYRADEDGILYENRWYTAKDGLNYYYGDGGQAYQGIHEINGKNYLFNSGGMQYINCQAMYNGGNYYCAPNGEATLLQNNSWTEVYGMYFYVKDGIGLKNCVAKIGEDYYGFDFTGEMQAGRTFSIWDEQKQKSICYCAKADGRLYVNETRTEFGKTYYYGDEGKAYSGPMEMNGKQYYFSVEGAIYIDECFMDGDKFYYCDPDGQPAQLNSDGWSKAFGRYFYIKDGGLLIDCIEWINGQYYAFKESGAMYAGEEICNYDFEIRDSIYYRAKEDGSLYRNEWYVYTVEDESLYYYYGADGKAYSGLHEVDGKLSYFGSNGYQYRNTDITVDGKLYHCGADGTATLLANNSWAKIEGKYYYVKDGTFLKNCVEKIGDAYYGFGGDGSLFTDGDFSIGDDYYCAYEDGRLYRNEWRLVLNDTYYYYGEDGKTYRGLHEIDGILYCFSEGGWRYQDTFVTIDGKRYYCDRNGKTTQASMEDGWTQIDGDYFYIKDGNMLQNCIEKINGYYYGFDQSGKMETGRFSIWDEASQNYLQYRAYEDGHLYVNEWYKSDYGSLYYLYYYGEDGKVYTGVHVIDGVTYCFNKDGSVYRNEMVSIDGKNYYCASDGTATLLDSDGWHLIDGNYCYIRNGELLKGCIVQIGQAYYGFRWNGILYQDEEFNQGDGTDTYYYYRAKEDGSLYVNEWYDSGSSPHYYGEGGRAYHGLYEIGGRTCYFDEYGCLRKNECVTDNDKLYYCDKQGNAALLQDNGWTIVNGTFLYAKDKEIIKDCVIWIDDAYYGFDYNGVMYSNQRLSLRGADGQYHEYRAKKDGKLYQNEWYENQYYYGENGVVASGWQQIDGKSYFFDFDGRIETNRVINEDGQNYYCGADGVAAQLQDNGWTEVDGKYFYANGNGLAKDCVMQINGQYYGFDENGMMYADRQFLIRKRENNTYTYSYYLAGADGVLYTNCWYSERNGGEIWLYYYGEDGQKYEGMRTIDGVQYYFDYHLIVNQVVAVNGINYYCNLSGKMTAMSNNSWYQGDDSAWYYVQNGVLLKNRSAQIGGQWYSFDENGKMVTQGVNVNPDGSLRVNTWGYDGTYWYYYGSDGMPYSDGFYEIEGATYYFTSGRLATSQMCKDSERTYFADAKGKLMQTSQNGWILTGGNYYYIENGDMVNSKVCKIQNAWYAFDWYGKMYADGEYSIWNDDEIFRAKSDGSLYVSQWYQADTGEWYYYGEDALAVSGLASVNGKTYVFGSDHTLGKNGAVRVNAAYYLANENGEWVRTPGWNLVGGNWYYVRSDGSLYTGILSNSGQQYYMEPSMATDVEIKNVNGTLYQIDANGYLSVASDGFHYRNGANELCYVSGGKSIETGWQNIGGSWYYFTLDKADGFVLAAQSGTYQIDGKWYYFDDEGKRVSNGWAVDKEGTWYYASASGELMTGDAEINGVLYHFKNSGELRSGVIIENSICKLYSKDGALLANGISQGWNLLGGDYYYMKDGVLLKNGSFCLEDGKWYLFDADGKMLTNVEADERWYGASGAALTGWFKQNGNWYYGNSFDAITYKGLHRINGAEYYFDKNGVMQTGGAVMNGTALVIDASGVVTEKYYVEDGWSSHGTEWYYYQNGVAYTGWVGVYYVSKGQMQRNQMVRTENNTYYYVGEDGAYQTNAWVNDGKSYAKANGLLAQNEWLKIDGKLYYFENWYPEIGEYESTNSDEQTGVYQEDGSFLSAKEYAKGWVFIDGHWYYKESENFVQNRSKKINGVWYQFDAYGKMMEN